MTKTITIRNNEKDSQFETEAEGGLALAAYHREGDVITFTHTEVPEEAEGQGIGGTLARAALDFARAEKLKVVPMCQFIAAFIKRHHEYRDLVPEEHQHRVK